MVRIRAAARKDLHEAAQELTADQAGLVAIGDPTLEQAADRAIQQATKRAERAFEDTADEISRELSDALKS